MNICLYHASDLDGQCSGAIYDRAHRGQAYTLWPIDYGDPIRWDVVDSADVTLIDFSFQPWSEFERLLKCAKSVTWIDHHRSAIKEHFESVLKESWCPTTMVLDEKKAACELAWEHYFPTKTMPEAVRLLGRYDVWDHSDPRTMPFQYGLRIYGLDPVNGKDRHLWETFLSPDFRPARHIDYGNVIMVYQKKQDAAAVANTWFPVDWEGLLWQACNRLGRGSTFFNSVWDAKTYHGMLSFSWDGHVWNIGLYSDRDDVDCGAIAKRHGGGGHPGSAGFRREELPFFKRRH